MLVTFIDEKNTFNANYWQVFNYVVHQNSFSIVEDVTFEEKQIEFSCIIFQNILSCENK